MAIFRRKRLSEKNMARPEKVLKAFECHVCLLRIGEKRATELYAEIAKYYNKTSDFKHIPTAIGEYFEEQEKFSQIERLPYIRGEELLECLPSVNDKNTSEIKDNFGAEKVKVVEECYKGIQSILDRKVGYEQAVKDYAIIVEKYNTNFPNYCPLPRTLGGYLLEYDAKIGKGDKSYYRIHILDLLDKDMEIHNNGLGWLGYGIQNVINKWTNGIGYKEAETRYYELYKQTEGQYSTRILPKTFDGFLGNYYVEKLRDIKKALIDFEKSQDQIEQYGTEELAWSEERDELPVQAQGVHVKSPFDVLHEDDIGSNEDIASKLNDEPEAPWKFDVSNVINKSIFALEITELEHFEHGDERNHIKSIRQGFGILGTRIDNEVSRLEGIDAVGGIGYEEASKMYAEFAGEYNKIVDAPITEDFDERLKNEYGDSSVKIKSFLLENDIKKEGQGKSFEPEVDERLELKTKAYKLIGKVVDDSGVFKPIEKAKPRNLQSIKRDLYKLSGEVLATEFDDAMGNNGRGIGYKEASEEYAKLVEEYNRVNPQKPITTNVDEWIKSEYTDSSKEIKSFLLENDELKGIRENIDKDHNAEHEVSDNSTNESEVDERAVLKAEVDGLQGEIEDISEQNRIGLESRNTPVDKTNPVGKVFHSKAKGLLKSTAAFINTKPTRVSEGEHKNTEQESKKVDPAVRETRPSSSGEPGRETRPSSSGEPGRETRPSSSGEAKRENNRVGSDYGTVTHNFDKIQKQHTEDTEKKERKWQKKFGIKAKGTLDIKEKSDQKLEEFAKRQGLSAEEVRRIPAGDNVFNTTEIQEKGNKERKKSQEKLQKKVGVRAKYNLKISKEYAKIL
ncbi:MAG: hypothetical protein PHI90_09640 [Clostridia bacterium]|nr:hypothetical protein [Clostridia bacterium]